MHPSWFKLVQAELLRWPPDRKRARWQSARAAAAMFAYVSRLVSTGTCAHGIGWMLYRVAECCQAIRFDVDRFRYFVCIIG